MPKVTSITTTGEGTKRLVELIRREIGKDIPILEGKYTKGVGPDGPVDIYTKDDAYSKVMKP
jgi:hypothetical protein